MAILSGVQKRQLRLSQRRIPGHPREEVIVIGHHQFLCCRVIYLPKADHLTVGARQHQGPP
jgi:hypothetical protein